MKTKRLFLASGILFTVFTGLFLTYILVSRAAGTSESWDILGDNTTWYQSSSSNNNSLQTVLASAANPPVQSGSHWVTPNKYTYVDISGDGLVDFVYHEKNSYGFNNYDTFTALFLNDGTNNFRLVYKCLSSGISSLTYYGDCAAGAPARDPNAPENQNMRAKVKNLMNYCDSDSQSSDTCTNTSTWVDINGDGLQDFIDQQCFYINSGAVGTFMFSNKICN